MSIFDGIDVDKKLQESKERADKHFSVEEEKLIQVDSVIKEKICSSEEDEKVLLELIKGLKAGGVFLLNTNRLYIHQ